MIRNTNSNLSKLFYEINRIKLIDVVGGLLFVCLGSVLGLGGLRKYIENKQGGLGFFCSFWFLL